ncbi:histidinol-phosphatase HisJ [Cytobacillus gottheilii]|uniref:histidinol-phosphatase HisJ n=1 Tax=Cytobacillus gottheilii TaxID=859144 RepID=UPI0009BBB079|nr:histidinol-phosphatase HisJ [Cytobacillus gottheilii]
MRKDGHIHTPYCPHGSKDSLESYIIKAISLGFQEISFTEHAPLPPQFAEPTPLKDSAMSIDRLEAYFTEVNILKEKYKNSIIVNAGLEVDFIEGYEQEIKAFLDEYGNLIDDSILSVHFLKHDNKYDCVDYSPDVFEEMISRYGSIEKVYNRYYQTVHHSINTDLGKYKPKRIGHINLVEKFKKKFQSNEDFKQTITSILTAIKQNGYELDYNGAGSSKPLCREPYPPLWAAQAALDMGIKLVYGSDAHQVKELGQGLQMMIGQQHLNR